MPTAWPSSGRRVAPPVRHTRTVPRRLVHKAGVFEVFVTDSREVATGHVSLAGELPRAHAYYNDLGERPDRLELMPVFELCRQACFVVAHRYYAVPLNRKFILRSLHGRLEPDALFEPFGDPAHVRVRCDVERHRRRDDDLTGLDWRFAIDTAERGSVATVLMSMSWMQPAPWRRLRAAKREGHGLPREVGRADPRTLAADPRSVGRGSERNVLVGDLDEHDGAVSGTVAVDVRHPGMFEHPQDHIPGMLEAEASRQVAIWAASRVMGRPAPDLAVAELEIRFDTVGELDLPTRCSGTAATADGGASVALELSQHGVALCRARLAVRAGSRC